MRVLISSAGRRTSLVEAFRKAVSPYNGIVVAADADPLAPGLIIADESEVVPRVDSSAFGETLLDICLRHEIDLVVPTIDTELGLLAQLAGRFRRRGIVVLISEPDLIEIAADKRLTQDYFGRLGIRTPASWDPRDLNNEALPERLFVKPNRGSASISTFPVAKANLSGILSLVPDPIIQEQIDATELSVDALLDLEGRVIHLVPRVRIKTVGGESVQGVTMPDEPIREWLLAVLEAVSSKGGRGPMTIQLFLTPGEPTLVEVNPRFGGGFPLALQAGGDYPAWLLEMVEGRTVAARLGRYKKGLFMTRALTEVFVDGGWEQ